MVKKYNFGAGPCILPAPVLHQAAQAVLDWNGLGLSILEVSHRSKDFVSVVEEAEELVRGLLNVPQSHSVLFLQGGASTQFSMIPNNFLQKKQKSSYLDTGFFAQKAIHEARLFGEVEIVASSRDQQYRYIPSEFEVAHASAYLHVTSNNTIEGSEMFDFPRCGVPLICDMSSDIFSRQIDVSAFDLIYAGAQKNIGPAGMTLVIARNSFLDTSLHPLPAMSDYKVHRDGKSMYNTPPVFSIYVAMLNLRWLKEMGGVEYIESINAKKAGLLYAEIDRNSLFTASVQRAFRSRMNLTFFAKDQATERGFLDLATKNGIVGIQGYRTVGGFRVSLYNAMDETGVHKLIGVMQQYEFDMLKRSQNTNLNQEAFQ